MITLLEQRPAGGVWVGSEVRGKRGFRLDVYDGMSFRKVLELGDEWQGANLRSVLERGTGEIWLGGTAGGGLYRDGKFSNPFQRENGYTDTGVFVLDSLPTGELVAGGRPDESLWSKTAKRIGSPPGRHDAGQAEPRVRSTSSSAPELDGG